MENRTTAEELTALRAGDLSAWDRWFSANMKIIFKAVWTILTRENIPNSRDLAAELVQDVALLGMKKINQFEGRSKLTTWFYVIATNHTRNRVKQERKQLTACSPATDTLDFLAVLYNQKTDPLHVDDVANESEISSAIQDTLNGMSPFSALVLRLCYQDELRYIDIANVLGLREFEITNELRRAREEFKTRFNESWPDFCPIKQDVKQYETPGRK